MRRASAPARARAASRTPTSAAITVSFVTRSKRVAAPSATCTSQAPPSAAASRASAIVVAVRRRRRPRDEQEEEGRPARDQDAAEKEPPSEDVEGAGSRRSGRQHGARGTGSGSGRTDAEGEDAGLEVPVIREHAPADAVVAVREVRSQRQDEEVVLPLEARWPGKHRAMVGGHDGVPGADGDGIVEVQPHRRGRGGQSGAVGRLDGDELRVRERSRRRREGNNDHEQEPWEAAHACNVATRLRAWTRDGARSPAPANVDLGSWRRRFPSPIARAAPSG